ncbi:hypothetical protein F3Y22_tig00006666pilonHSYRG00008 [Hibiscus syriacus]|uniref:Pentatricopeptide repeat-containing protein n=1 Tax=Hibiscus syriacus TaxID=106335 RepID=A0A6A3CHC0_HIBSY|nr:hypothetical protein F3Y22_tig00006666pilonHSYRG00008 [Hibiscus syriacus]
MAIKACVSLMDMEMGEDIWRKAVDFGYLNDVFVASSILNLYVKCGKMDEAVVVFNKMPMKDLVCWTTTHSQYALRVFKKMPSKNDISYGALISGFMHWNCWLDLEQVPGTAMIDVYAKCGLLSYAVAVFDRIVSKDMIFWNAMIASYGVHGHGKEALSLSCQLTNMSLKPVHATFTAPLISPLRTVAAVTVRKLMKDPGRNVPGYSVLDVNGKLPGFLMRDKTHHEYEAIAFALDKLNREMIFMVK